MFKCGFGRVSSVALQNFQLLHTPDTVTTLFHKRLVETSIMPSMDNLSSVTRREFPPQYEYVRSLPSYALPITR